MCSFKWFISFPINLGTKIKLTFSANKGAVELENIYSKLKKKNCLLRAQFLLKNKHHRLPEKEEKPPADTFSHWLMMLSWQSRFRNGNPGTNELSCFCFLFFFSVKYPLKERSQISRHCIWNVEHSCLSLFFEKQNGFVLWSHSYGIIQIWRTPGNMVMCDIMD